MSEAPALTTFERVREALIEYAAIEAEKIIPTATLIGDLSFDSLDVVEVAMELEERFDIEIPDDELLTEDSTVQKLVDLIDKLVKAK